MIILRQNTYSRRVYEGLSKIEAEKLAKERKRIARNLRSTIKNNNSIFKKDKVHGELNNKFAKIDAINEAKLAKENILTGKNKKYETLLEKQSKELQKTDITPDPNEGLYRSYILKNR